MASLSKQRCTYTHTHKHCRSIDLQQTYFYYILYHKQQYNIIVSTRRSVRLSLLFAGSRTYLHIHCMYRMNRYTRVYVIIYIIIVVIYRRRRRPYSHTFLENDKITRRDSSVGQAYVINTTGVWCIQVTPSWV